MSRNLLFISHRRDKTLPASQSIYNRVAGVLEQRRVFYDSESLDPTDDFSQIFRHIGKSCLVITLIGEDWDWSSSSPGAPMDPNGWFLQELNAAELLGIETVPVLIGNAELPRRTQNSPVALRRLLSQHAVRVTFGSNEATDRGIAEIERRYYAALDRAERKGDPSFRPVEKDVYRSGVKGVLGAMVVLVFCLAAMGWASGLLGRNAAEEPSAASSFATLPATTATPTSVEAEPTSTIAPTSTAGSLPDVAADVSTKRDPRSDLAIPTGLSESGQGIDPSGRPFISLRWQKPTGVPIVQIERDGLVIRDDDNLAFRDVPSPALVPGQQVTYRVRSMGGDGRLSAWSERLIVVVGQ